MCPQDTRKNFKPAKTSSSSSSASHSTPSTQLFLAQVLSHLLETHSAGKPLHEPPQGGARTKALLSSEAISCHIDELRFTRVHTAALQISTEHIARYDYHQSKLCHIHNLAHCLCLPFYKTFHPPNITSYQLHNKLL